MDPFSFHPTLHYSKKCLPLPAPFSTQNLCMTVAFSTQNLCMTVAFSTQNLCMTAVLAGQEDDVLTSSSCPASTAVIRVPLDLESLNFVNL